MQFSILGISVSRVRLSRVVQSASERSVYYRNRTASTTLENMTESKAISYGMAAAVQRKVQLKHYTQLCSVLSVRLNSRGLLNDLKFAVLEKTIETKILSHAAWKTY